MQASARLALGMSTDDHDDESQADVETEPFDTDPLLRASLVRRTMTNAILVAQSPPTWEAIAALHARASLAAELAGRGPAGIYRATAAAGEEQILRTWQAELPAVLGTGRADCRTFRFVPNLEAGATAEPEPGGAVVHRCAPSFVVTVPAGSGEPTREVAVAVVGETGLWARGAGESALAFTTRKSARPDDLGREDLAAFLDYVALAAAGSEPSGFRSVLFHAAKDRPGQRARPFGRLSAREAQDYLRGLCTALVAGGPDGAAVHSYLLPYEAVLASRRRGTEVAEEIATLCATEENREGFSSTRGPVPDATLRYAAPAAADAERMIAERFGLFFRLAEEGA